MSEPQVCFAVDLGFYGNLFVRQVIYPQIGDYAPDHDHSNDHITMVSQGRVHITCQVTGLDNEFTAPAFVEVPAKSRHKIVALEPNSCTWCIFSVNHISETF